MSTNTICALLITGALFELAGIVLVGVDVIAARRARGELSRGAQLAQIGAVWVDAGGVPPKAFTQAPSARAHR